MAVRGNDAREETSDACRRQPRYLLNSRHYSNVWWTVDPARAEGVIKPPGHFSPFVETILVLRKGGYAAHLSPSLCCNVNRVIYGCGPLAIEYWAIKRIRARLKRIRVTNRQHTERLEAGLRVYCILSVIRILRPLTEFGLRDGLQIAYKDWISFGGGSMVIKFE